MQQPCVKIRRLPHAEGLPLPAYKTAQAAGADVCAAVEDELVIRPGERIPVPTGLVLEIPPGFEVQVRPRSGLALSDGITLPNSPGTIDADYRGELMVLLINLGPSPFHIKRGMRVAQLLVAPVCRAAFEESPLGLSETDRGENGFGSTGLH